MGIACSEEKVGLYTRADSYVYFPFVENYQVAILIDSSHFFYNKEILKVNSAQQRDTFYFRLYTSGWQSDVDRKIEIELFPVKINGKETAVSGVNFVPFDDPEMLPHLVMPADSMATRIPVIVKYDQAIAGQRKALAVGLRLVETEDFKVMGVQSNLLDGNSARPNVYVQFNQE